MHADPLATALTDAAAAAEKAKVEKMRSQLLRNVIGFIYALALGMTGVTFFGSGLFSSPTWGVNVSTALHLVVLAVWAPLFGNMLTSFRKAPPYVRRSSVLSHRITQVAIVLALLLPFVTGNSVGIVMAVVLYAAAHVVAHVAVANGVSRTGRGA